MRAALYARVSTNAGQDPTVQLRELRALCERRQWDVGGIFTDVGVSGSEERSLTWSSSIATTDSPAASVT